jgi:hypothetical protein
MASIDERELRKRMKFLVRQLYMPWETRELKETSSEIKGRINEIRHILVEPEKMPITRDMIEE